LSRKKNETNNTAPTNLSRPLTIIFEKKQKEDSLEIDGLAEHVNNGLPKFLKVELEIPESMAKPETCPVAACCCFCCCGGYRCFPTYK